jgi:tetratricopeptide (TPR) repeat protein
LAYSGRLEEARKKSRRAADLAQQAKEPGRAALFKDAAALWEAFFGNATAARQGAEAAVELSKDRDVEYGAAFALALSGESARSQKLADDLETRFPEDTEVKSTYLPPIRALLALNHHEPAKAIELLQSAIPYDLGTPLCSAPGFFGILYTIYVRGLAYVAAHQGPEAAAEFHKILDHRVVVVSDPIGALAHLELGRALTQSGDMTKAKTAYQDFLTLSGVVIRSIRFISPDVALIDAANTQYGSMILANSDSAAPGDEKRRNRLADNFASSVSGFQGNSGRSNATGREQLVQRCVLFLGFDEDRDILIGVFPGAVTSDQGSFESLTS